MELVQELFFAAFVALFFSFFIAKLVSISAGGDEAGRDSVSKSSEIADKGAAVVEEVRFERGLKVERAKSKRRVRFVDEVVVRTVEEFEAERAVAEFAGFGSEETCDGAGGIEVEQSSEELSEVAGFTENSSEMGFVGVEEMAVEVVGVGEYGKGVANKDVETGSEEHAVQEKGEEAEFLESASIDEENVVNRDSYDSIVDEKPGNDASDEKTIEKSMSNDVVEDRIHKVSLVEAGDNKAMQIERELDIGSDDDDEEEEEKKKEIDCDGDNDDDWEGIERSELEKVFAAAADYVGCGGKDDHLADVGSDLQMQFYGLHRVAMEGPCHAPQPMALKVSARAKWNAWQRLGNMSPEEAMEQYVGLLSDTVPGWAKGNFIGDSKVEDFLEAGKPSDQEINISTFDGTRPKGKMEVDFGKDDGLNGSSVSKDADKE